MPEADNHLQIVTYHLSVYKLLLRVLVLEPGVAWASPDSLLRGMPWDTGAVKQACDEADALRLPRAAVTIREGWPGRVRLPRALYRFAMTEDDASNPLWLMPFLYQVLVPFRDFDDEVG